MVIYSQILFIWNKDKAKLFEQHLNLERKYNLNN